MRRTWKATALGVAVTGVVALAVLTLGPASSSATDHDPPPIHVEPLTPRSAFIDDVSAQLRVKLDGQRTRVLNVADPDRVAVARITVQPGAQFPWHTHPGPVIVTVAEGELTYVGADDCRHRPYPAGTVFVDPGRGNVHTAYSSSEVVTTVIATFFEAPVEGPLTIPVDPPADCQVGAGTSHDH